VFILNPYVFWGIHRIINFHVPWISIISHIHIISISYPYHIHIISIPYPYSMSTGSSGFPIRCPIGKVAVSQCLPPSSAALRPTPGTWRLGKTYYVHMQYIPSGKHTKNYGKIHHFSWENSL
jgi:hypothetical protein